MGYFSNGTEGMAYEEQFCCKCVHQHKCIIWDLHMMYNYDQLKEGNETMKAFLEFLIPMEKTEFGMFPGECSMFHKKKAGET